MCNYTAGNWEIDPNTGNINVDGHIVACVFGATVHNREDNSAECMANARLITNAPKILHALRKARSLLEYQVYAQVFASEIDELTAEIDGSRRDCCMLANDFDSEAEAIAAWDSSEQ